MKDFAIIVKSPEGQVFGVSGEHTLKFGTPIEGSGNIYRFNLPHDLSLDLIIVEHQKTSLAVWVGHHIEVLKARLRRFGNSLARI